MTTPIFPKSRKLTRLAKRLADAQRRAGDAYMNYWVEYNAEYHRMEKRRKGDK